MIFTTVGYRFLTKQAALQSIICRIEDQPDYRPGWYRRSRANSKQLRKDLNDSMAGFAAEGSA